jgi:GT2 family glycosyltransferase
MEDLLVGDTPPKVAILILNWNDRRNTLETLESVRDLRYPNLAVFLVDNGSTDGSVEVVSEQFHEVHLIVSPENLGAPAGRNLGLEEILRHSDAEYVLILDNDVILEPCLLNTLIESVEKETDVGIVGPIIYYYAQPKRIWSAGKSMVFREVLTKLLAKNRVETEEPPAGIKRVDCITGACMLVKRRVFERVGYFDPRYFLACEDTEFCVRAAKRGFASAVVTHAKLWHKVSASTGGGYTPPRTYYTGRSTILFLKEHGRPWNWITAITFATLGLPIAYLRERRRGNQRAVVMKLRGYLDGLLGRPVNREVEEYFQRPHLASVEKVHARRDA